VTLEANPGALEYGSFEGYRHAGVNRISLGAQSFEPAFLKRLGRIHSPQETHQAIGDLKAAGFGNFNVDLMNQLPDQSVELAISDLQTLIDLEPTHISLYELTIEPNTVFAAFPPPPLNEDVSEQMHGRSLELLAQAGYVQYEVSAFARSGCEGRHNLNYWEFGDYLGIGAGAHSKWTRDDGVIERGENLKLPREYLANQEVRAVQAISAERLPFEYCLNALRLVRGFELGDYESRTGLSRDSLNRPLEVAAQRGWVLREGDRVRASARGYRYLNAVLELFLD